jgi:hypothetical protein
MTTPAQRIHEVTKAQLDALDKFKADIDAATTKAEKSRIATNLLTLKGANEIAIENGMLNNNAAIERAYIGLTAANQAVAQARADAEAIANIIKKVTEVAKLGTKLVSLAII